MLEILMCGYNITCSTNVIGDMLGYQKYPSDHAIVCQYFEEIEQELPDYCKWKSKIKLPRKRSEF